MPVLTIGFLLSFDLNLPREGGGRAAVTRRVPGVISGAWRAGGQPAQVKRYLMDHAYLGYSNKTHQSVAAGPAHHAASPPLSS